MQEKHKRHILKNINIKSIKEISETLGLKERKIKKFLEKEKLRNQSKELHQNSENTAAIPLNPSGKLWMIVGFILLGFTVYSNTFHSSFHFDDTPSIINNSAIKNIRDLQHIWNFWPTRFITYLSIALNYHFHQLDVFGYHVFNLMVHLSSAVMVGWLALLTFSTPAMKGQKVSCRANLISFFAGVVFLTHPIQTEGVTYIVQRAASMATFFYLASLNLYIQARLNQIENSSSSISKLYYSGFLLAVVICMFCKEIAISLPLMIGFYEFYFFGSKKVFNVKYVIFLLSIFLIVPLTMLMTHTADLQGMRRIGEDTTPISVGHYFLTQMSVIGTYLRILLIPISQNLDYDYPIATSFFQTPVFFSFLLLCFIGWVAIKLFPKHRLLSFSIFWFFISLLPESSVIPIKDVIFEHRLYLPMVGYSLFLVGSTYYLFGKRRPILMVVVLALMIACYSILTYTRNSVWKDNLTLWSDAVRKSPHKARPYFNRGYAYQEKENFDEALSDYDKAIQIKPDYAEVYSNRGNIYTHKGNLDQAFLDLNKAIEIKPRLAEAYNNRGYAYQDKGNLDQAFSDYNKAIEIKPDFAEAHNNRGYAYASKGNLNQALSDLNKAIDFKPDYADAYSNRGNAYAYEGNFDHALSDYDKAIKINPDSAEVYNNRGNA